MQIIRSGPSTEAIAFTIFAAVLAIGAFLAPYVVAFILTRFEPQQSTQLQRGWLIFWLAFGQYPAAFLGWGFYCAISFRSPESMFDLYRLGIFSVPAIGIWVIVAKMIMENGICKIM